MDIEKEDGISEHCLVQLKSTDHESISIKQKDIRVLEYNATTAHRMPVFAIQFLNTGEIWLMVKPDDIWALQDVTGACKPIKDFIDLDIDEEQEKEYNTKDNSFKPDPYKQLQARMKYQKQMEEQKQKEKEERKKQKRWQNKKT